VECAACQQPLPTHVAEQTFFEATTFLRVGRRRVVALADYVPGTGCTSDGAVVISSVHTSTGTPFDLCIGGTPFEGWSVFVDPGSVTLLLDTTAEIAPDGAAGSAGGVGAGAGRVVTRTVDMTDVSFGPVIAIDRFYGQPTWVGPSGPEYPVELLAFASATVAYVAFSTTLRLGQTAATYPVVCVGHNERYISNGVSSTLRTIEPTFLCANTSSPLATQLDAEVAAPASVAFWSTPEGFPLNDDQTSWVVPRLPLFILTPAAPVANSSATGLPDYGCGMFAALALWQGTVAQANRTDPWVRLNRVVLANATDSGVASVRSSALAAACAAIDASIVQAATGGSSSQVPAQGLVTGVSTGGGSGNVARVFLLTDPALVASESGSSPQNGVITAVDTLMLVDTSLLGGVFTMSSPVAIADPAFDPPRPAWTRTYGPLAPATQNCSLELLDPGTDAATPDPVAGSNVLYVKTPTCGLEALDVDTGAVIWSRPNVFLSDVAAGGRGANTTSVAVAKSPRVQLVPSLGNTMIHNGEQQLSTALVFIAAPAGQITALDVQTGAVLSSLPFFSVASGASPWLGDGAQFGVWASRSFDGLQGGSCPYCALTAAMFVFNYAQLGVANTSVVLAPDLLYVSLFSWGFPTKAVAPTLPAQLLMRRTAQRPAEWRPWIPVTQWPHVELDASNVVCGLHLVQDPSASGRSDAAFWLEICEKATQRYPHAPWATTCAAAAQSLSFASNVSRGAHVQRYRMHLSWLATTRSIVVVLPPDVDPDIGTNAKTSTLPTADATGISATTTLYELPGILMSAPLWQVGDIEALMLRNVPSLHLTIAPMTSATGVIELLNCSHVRAYTNAGLGSIVAFHVESTPLVTVAEAEPNAIISVLTDTLLRYIVVSNASLADGTLLPTPPPTTTSATPIRALSSAATFSIGYVVLALLSGMSPAVTTESGAALQFLDLSHNAGLTGPIYSCTDAWPSIQALVLRDTGLFAPARIDPTTCPSLSFVTSTVADFVTTIHLSSCATADSRRLGWIDLAENPNLSGLIFSLNIAQDGTVGVLDMPSQWSCPISSLSLINLTSVGVIDGRRHKATNASDGFSDESSNASVLPIPNTSASVGLTIAVEALTAPMTIVCQRVEVNDSSLRLVIDPSGLNAAVSPCDRHFTPPKSAASIAVVDATGASAQVPRFTQCSLLAPNSDRLQLVPASALAAPSYHHVPNASPEFPSFATVAVMLESVTYRNSTACASFPLHWWLSTNGSYGSAATGDALFVFSQAIARRLCPCVAAFLAGTAQAAHFPCPTTEGAPVAFDVLAAADTLHPGAVVINLRQTGNKTGRLEELTLFTVTACPVVDLNAQQPMCIQEPGPLFHQLAFSGVTANSSEHAFSVDPLQVRATYISTVAERADQRDCAIDSPVALLASGEVFPFPMVASGLAACLPTASNMVVGQLDQCVYSAAAASSGSTSGSGDVAAGQLQCNDNTIIASAERCDLQDWHTVPQCPRILKIKSSNSSDGDEHDNAAAEAVGDGFPWPDAEVTYPGWPRFLYSGRARVVSFTSCSTAGMDSSVDLGTFIPAGECRPLSETFQPFSTQAISVLDHRDSDGYWDPTSSVYSRCTAAASCSFFDVDTGAVHCERAAWKLSSLALCMASAGYGVRYAAGQLALGLPSSDTRCTGPNASVTSLSEQFDASMQSMLTAAVYNSARDSIVFVRCPATAVLGDYVTAVDHTTLPLFEMPSGSCTDGVKAAALLCQPYIFPEVHAIPYAIMFLSSLKDIALALIGIALCSIDPVRRASSRVSAAILVRMAPFKPHEQKQWAATLRTRMNPRQVRPRQLVENFLAVLGEGDTDNNFGLTDVEMESILSESSHIVVPAVPPPSDAIMAINVESGTSFAGPSDYHLPNAPTLSRFFTGAGFNRIVQRLVGLDDDFVFVASDGNDSEGCRGSSGSGNANHSITAAAPKSPALLADSQAGLTSPRVSAGTEDAEAPLLQQRQTSPPAAPRTSDISDRQSPLPDPASLASGRNVGGSFGSDEKGAGSNHSFARRLRTQLSSLGSRTGTIHGSLNAGRRPEYLLFERLVLRHGRCIIANPDSEEVRLALRKLLAAWHHHNIVALVMWRRAATPLEVHLLTQLRAVAQFEDVLLPEEAIKLRFMPPVWALILQSVFAIVSTLVSVADVAQRYHTADAWTQYQVVAFYVVNSAATVGLFANSLLRRFYLEDWRPDVFIILSAGLLVAPFCTHIIVGAALYAWLTILVAAGLAVVAVAATLFVRHARILLTDRRTGQEFRVARVVLWVALAALRILLALGLSALVQTAFTYAVLYYERDRNRLGYMDRITREWTARDIRCTIVSVHESLSNLLQIVSAFV
jgi:hypothetical protein